ncbi:ABC transporter permease [Candidatus Atribacteria bacterium 1244-E10-H5-B2]|nr:MAG: ABC transporter permease [Candidatus Atribacteria bacterium 1244-E10-H5-B2]
MSEKFIYFNKSIRIKIKTLRESLHSLKRNNLTFAALIVILSLVIIAIIAPIIAPFPSHIYGDVNPQDKLLSPSKVYFFGTDEAGRDIFSRVLYGTRISLLSSLTAVVIGLIIGVPLGLIAGFYGRFADELIMRIVDMFLSFPPLLLAMVVAAYLGPSLRNAILAIIIAWWPWYTRLIRGQVVSIKEREFVRSAKAIGTSSWTIIFKHILPNCISPVMVQASMDLGGVILTLASLSFLGLGAQAPTPEWGLMINVSRTYFLKAWWYSVFPGIAIFINVLSFNFLGDGIREILDPKTNK